MKACKVAKNREGQKEEENKEGDNQQTTGNPYKNACELLDENGEFEAWDQQGGSKATSEDSVQW